MLNIDLKNVKMRMTFTSNCAITTLKMLAF
jgi:hypothetical protein